MLVLPSRRATIRPQLYVPNRGSWQAHQLFTWWTGAGFRDLRGPVQATGGTRGTVHAALAERGVAELFTRSSSQYAYVDQTPSVASPIYPLTLTAWVRVTERFTASGTNFMIPIAYGDSGGTGSRAQLNFNEDGSNYWMRMNVIDAGGGNNAATSTTQWQAHTTYHVIGRYITDANYDIWVNGVREHSNNDSKNVTGTGRCAVGGRWNGSAWAGYWDGQILDARVYSRGLTDAECVALYQPATRWDLYWTPKRRYVEISAGVATLDAGTQTVVVTAPPTTLGLGAVTLSAGTQAAVVTAPSATLTSGTLTLTAGDQAAVVTAPAVTLTVGAVTLTTTEQLVVVTAPTATLVQGGVTNLDAGIQAAVVTAPTTTFGLGDVTLTAGTQAVVVTAPSAALVTPTVTMGAYVELGGTERTTVTLRTATLEYRTRGAGTLTGRFVARASSVWRPQLLDRLTLWDPAQLFTGTDMAAGSTQLVRSAGGFTADLVGQHVRVNSAAHDGHALLTTVASWQASSVVALTMAASTTITGAVALAGRARFTGTLRDLSERRRGPASTTLVYDVDAEAVSRVPDVLYPSSQTRPAETFYRRLQALVDAGLDDHGLLLHWPLTSGTLDLASGGPLALEAGGDLTLETGPEGTTLAAAAYDGTQSFAALLDAMVTEDDTGRQWRIDALGRLHVDATPSVMPTSLTAADLIGLPTVRYALEDYANRVDYYYGEALDAVVTCINSTEVGALDGRVYARPVNDTTASNSATAFTRATAILTTLGTRARYGLTFATLVDSLEPGQVGLITLAPHSIAGTHYLQTVRSSYRGHTLTRRWRHEVTAVNSTVASPVEEYVDFWEESSPEALSDLERSLRQWAASTFQQA